MMNTDETIFALSTVFGKSGVAVIRISGNHALKALNHFHVNKDMKPRFATLVDLYDSSDQLIDNGIAIYFPAPNSFTGEDVIELQVHGGKAVIKIVLEELSRIFVMAKPGEFLLRAFLNGKFDLTQIEGIADLIDAETKMQAKQAIKQMSGELEKLYSSWRQRLIAVQSKIEAYIDFPEDVATEKNELEKINDEVQTLVQSIQEHLNDNRRGERLREGLHIVITGEPNVGKSTLFNFLARRDIAIVSEYVGTTRDILEAHIDIGGYPIILSDTAGIRESSDPVESEGISRAKKRSCEADLRIELFPFEQRYNINCNVISSNTIYVLSKADDVINDHDIKISDIDFLPVSILKGIGTEKLVSVIKEKVEEKFVYDRDVPVITRQRHRNCMQKAIEHLRRFNMNNPIELVSEDLRLAASELGVVTGIINVEEVLDDIFNNFCVGK
ncbi:tRNA uridine-5-carboxymethylaminomethyl(34) synthesis GTPase MnmE [Wolbachia endosymbiont of Brugia malayi]|uniref:tRNA modification GTPase MnmE n=1 Tax=Wolbachia sp. subsp. Brugia malayi (strain TRS) TaxID=292805 RepID=MNME_WOLTR|nr:tRNA uridine-5-carboxymethylaminomethyl(34) synthesis GTPase MnmE [Wolbachia endosymbiont of Brugia malayi]Q5GTQ0.1 RecName: Full=tRNA modification GTPase MnmE [Wolbachia endosymbiont strain TRS of Brugia malayi]AAW70624.1 Predicted GTPase [Wolbachia endosymbiont strain TRS of Brugia malayi]QCB61611.1 tRNA uridine-5-carboxymethylaminomethyl(34) synthesis GTPase MnmE [Wolbachia endosymbiont of Brugia malayi]